MSNQPSPERIEEMKRVAKGIYAAQQKLLQKRKELQGLLTDAEQRVRLLDPKAAPRTAAFARAQRRVAEIGLAQMEVFPLEMTVFQPVSGLDGPIFEARNLDLQFASLEIDQQMWGVVADQLAIDMPRAEAGEPARPAAPAAWVGAYTALAADYKAQAELWDRFLSDFAAFDAAATEITRQQIEAGRSPNAAAYVALIRQLKIPAANGLAYRVRLALKAIDGAEAMVIALAKPLRTLPKARSEGTAPMAPLTDRLKNMFGK